MTLKYLKLLTLSFSIILLSSKSHANLCLDNFLLLSSVEERMSFEANDFVKKKYDQLNGELTSFNLYAQLNKSKKLSLLTQEQIFQSALFSNYRKSLNDIAWTKSKFEDWFYFSVISFLNISKFSSDTKSGYLINFLGKTIDKLNEVFTDWENPEAKKYIEIIEDISTYNLAKINKPKHYEVKTIKDKKNTADSNKVAQKDFVISLEQELYWSYRLIQAIINSSSSEKLFSEINLSNPHESAAVNIIIRLINSKFLNTHYSLELEVSTDGLYLKLYRLVKRNIIEFGLNHDNYTAMILISHVEGRKSMFIQQLGIKFLDISFKENSLIKSDTNYRAREHELIPSIRLRGITKGWIKPHTKSEVEAYNESLIPY